jgi:hypothetical protein
MPRTPKKNVEIVSEARASRRKEQAPLLVMGALLVLALGVAGYFYYQYSHTSQVAEANEIKSLVEKLGKVISLPQNEAPTLATVTNKEKLDNQPFFQKAENGDKILIYSDASQAILYRPSTGKIIDMTTVNVVKDKAPESNFQEPEAPVVEPVPDAVPVTPVETSGTTTAAPTEIDPTTIVATLALYNGSTKIGVTNYLEKQINTTFPLLTVWMKEKAVKNDYQGNLIIDLSGKNAELAQKIAESIGGKVGALPSGESNPGTDLVIIVGNK